MRGLPHALSECVRKPARPRPASPVVAAGGRPPARRPTRAAPRPARRPAVLDRRPALRRRAAALEAADQLVQPELLEPGAHGLELGGAELDEVAPLATELQRLAQAGLARVQAADDG